MKKKTITGKCQYCGDKVKRSNLYKKYSCRECVEIRFANKYRSRKLELQRIRRNKNK